MRFRSLATGGLSVALAILSSCGTAREMRSAIPSVARAQADVRKSLGEKDVGLTLTSGRNGKFLGVRLVNSPLNDLSPAEKSVKAFEIARIAYNAYADRASIQAVFVVFAIQKTYFGVFRYGGSAGTFRVDSTRLANEPFRRPIRSEGNLNLPSFRVPWGGLKTGAPIVNRRY